jgi:hypothetical protein
MTALDRSQLAMRPAHGYRRQVAAKSATGFDGPISRRRTSATITIAGAFFVPVYIVYGGCAWETLGSAGFLLPRSVNLRTAATLIRLTANRGSSSAKGASTMHATKLSASRAAAHRAMAIAALHADSSLTVRLRRYNHHMDKARSLESAQRA